MCVVDRLGVAALLSSHFRLGYTEELSSLSAVRVSYRGGFLGLLGGYARLQLSKVSEEI